MVRDDEEDSVAVGMIETRQPEANGTVPAGGFPPSASSATLTQRLQRKLSAIPAYLQTSDDPEGLRVTSPESSGTSLSGYATFSLCSYEDPCTLALVLCLWRPFSAAVILSLCVTLW